MFELDWKHVLACPALALAVTAAPLHAANITYNFVDYPADQNGHTLSGTITTDGTIGLIDETNIVSYELTVTGPSGFSLSTANGDAVSTLTSSVNATATELQLFPTTGATNRLIFSEIEIPSFGSMVVEWDRRFDDDLYEAVRIVGVEVAWSAEDPVMNGSDPWIIAVVPEPSSLALLSLSGLLVARRRRSLY